ncbi:MAG: hypothetical protein MUC64_07440 [Rubritepida sp.]|jgi:hypothetical protein|nr:hypothetical protein [Rubritepida sp.]
MQLRLNAKDVVSGILLLLFALVGLYLNQDHSLGSARRMGPGYMPMMTFYLLGGLAVWTILIGLFSGPDPFDKWTGFDWGTLFGGIAAGYAAFLIAPSLSPFFGQVYNAVGFGILVGMLVFGISPGWRFLGIVCASVALFGLLLEKGGFFLTLTGLILLSCVAEREHVKHPLGVAGLLGFLLLLCWYVFIKELDIRVNLWPEF